MSVFKGICTAMITPFKRGEIDFESFARLIDRQLDAQVSALLVCGTTGEPCTMSDDEKLTLLHFAAERVNGRVPVIAGVGGNNTSTTAAFARAVNAVGANAILSVTPYYNKCTQDGLISHYEQIAEACDLPIIIYNVPSRTGFNILPETAKKLSEIENICAIKEASGSITQCAEVAMHCGGKLDLYSGNDDMLLPVLSIGGIGGISVLSNIFPHEMNDICRLFFDGRIDEAAKIQLRLLPIMKLMFLEVNPIPVKAASSLLGLCQNELRLPLTPMMNKHVKTLRDELARLGRL